MNSLTADTKLIETSGILIWLFWSSKHNVYEPGQLLFVGQILILNLSDTPSFRFYFKVELG